MTFAQVQAQGLGGSGHPPGGAALRNQLSYVAQAAGHVHHPPAAGTPLRRTARRFDVRVPVTRPRSVVAALSSGNRAHRPPTDAHHPSDLPLAGPALGQQTLDLLDDRRGDHRTLNTQAQQKRARRRNDFRRRALGVPDGSGSFDTRQTTANIIQAVAQFQGLFLASLFHTLFHVTACSISETTPSSSSTSQFRSASFRISTTLR